MGPAPLIRHRDIRRKASQNFAESDARESRVSNHAFSAMMTKGYKLDEGSVRRQTERGIEKQPQELPHHTRARSPKLRLHDARGIADGESHQPQLHPPTTSNSRSLPVGITTVSLWRPASLAARPFTVTDFN